MTTALETLGRDPNFKEALQRAREATKILTQPEARGFESTGTALSEAEVESAADAIGRGDIESAFRTASGMAMEAIVRGTLRPSFYMSKDKVLSSREGVSPVARRLMEEMNLEFSDRGLFETNREILETAALSAGRLNLVFGFREYAGTGWLLDDDIVITNRHVAHLFAQRWMQDEWDFQNGQFDRKVQVQFNPVEQIDTDDDRSVRIREILWVAEPGEPDMALLRVQAPNVEPIRLAEREAAAETPIAVVGYPARDPRDNPEHLIVSFFGDKFGIKRFAPGRVMSSGSWVLDHDATTLGGNSGSVVIAMETGEAVGLHFAGSAMERNIAVPAALVGAALRRIKSSVAMPAVLIEEAAETEASKTATFADREGYARDFLGHQVPIPNLGRRAEDLAPVEGTDDNELRYCHFSVWQSRARRLPLITAVNIDGKRLRRIPREGRWRLDGRLAQEHQAGNVLYRRNPLDRGHMVRRLDPCWAEDLDDEATVLKAQADTFHYTNAVPQHENLNQGDWVGLEDYVLDAAEKFDFKVSVMTGPVFRDDDRPLRSQRGAEDIKIPLEFWKVAVMRQPDDGTLSATGYVLSHGRMIRGLTEAEFVLGAYETYQVPLRMIEEATGFDFGDLKKSDPLAVETTGQAAFGRQIRRIHSSDDLVLTPASA